MAKMRTNFKCSLRDEEVKKTDMILKESRASKLNFDTDNQLSQFYSKVFINSGPFYICVICNRCLCRRSMGLFNSYKLSIVSDDAFRLLWAFEGTFRIPKTYPKKLNVNCIPC